ncbi:MAG: DNA recombination protein RmuC [Luteibaculaceae bacterium]|jgi:DNA recombination protein RmuC
MLTLIAVLCGTCLLLLLYLVIQQKSAGKGSESLLPITNEIEKSARNSEERLWKNLNQQLLNSQDRLDLISKQNREELRVSLLDLKEEIRLSLERLKESQKDSLQLVQEKQAELIKNTEVKLENIRLTVDEKLHKTLEERLGQSFKLVGERLEAVQLGLGEMKELANGVGDLKRVLSNVKTRGTLGEIQLGNILEQILAPEQYEANVKTKKGSDALVEFAVKLPGKTQDEPVYLPIDAKFPQEDFYRLQVAFEASDAEAVAAARKALYNTVKSFAKDIREKYIDPPNTTDFGIMFLPVEGLYAELVRDSDLMEHIQRNFSIILTGPTTLAAMLNSLQMGFKTLAIEKRSSDVWRTLGEVKTEFQKFGGVLSKAQKKINDVHTDLDQLIGTRSRVMMRKLKEVEALPAENTPPILLNEEESPEKEPNHDH